MHNILQIHYKIIVLGGQWILLFGYDLFLSQMFKQELLAIFQHMKIT